VRSRASEGGANPWQSGTQRTFGSIFSTNQTDLSARKSARGPLKTGSPAAMVWARRRFACVTPRY